MTNSGISVIDKNLDVFSIKSWYADWQIQVNRIDFSAQPVSWSFDLTFSFGWNDYSTNIESNELLDYLLMDTKIANMVNQVQSDFPNRYIAPIHYSYQNPASFILSFDGFGWSSNLFWINNNTLQWVWWTQPVGTTVQVLQDYMPDQYKPSFVMTPSSWTYRVYLDWQLSNPLPFNASSAQLQNEIRSMDSRFSSVDVYGDYTSNFIVVLNKMPVWWHSLDFENIDLNPRGWTKVSLDNGTREIQQVVLDNNPTGWDFKLKYSFNWTEVQTGAIMFSEDESSFNMKISDMSGILAGAYPQFYIGSWTGERPYANVFSIVFHWYGWEANLLEVVENTLTYSWGWGMTTPVDISLNNCTVFDAKCDNSSILRLTDCNVVAWDFSWFSEVFMHWWWIYSFLGEVDLRTQNNSRLYNVEMLSNDKIYMKDSEINWCRIENGVLLFWKNKIISSFIVNSHLYINDWDNLTIIQTEWDWTEITINTGWNVLCRWVSGFLYNEQWWNLEVAWDDYDNSISWLLATDEKQAIDELAEMINNIDIELLETITFDDLKLLKDNNELVPWKKYLIKDFESVMKIGNSAEYNTWDQEWLVVLATSENTLSKHAVSVNRPQDKIVYDFDKNYIEWDSNQYLESGSYNFDISVVDATNFTIDLLWDTPLDVSLRVFEKWYFDINFQDTSSYTYADLWGWIYWITILSWTINNPANIIQQYEENFWPEKITVFIDWPSTLRIITINEPVWDSFDLELESDWDYFTINNGNYGAEWNYTEVGTNEYVINLLTYTWDLTWLETWVWRLYAYTMYKKSNTKWYIERRFDPIKNIETNYDFVSAKSRLYSLDLNASNILPYDSWTTYSFWNAVIHNNIIYKCLVQTTGNTPATTGTKYWSAVFHNTNITPYYLCANINVGGINMVKDDNLYVDFPVISTDWVSFSTEWINWYKNTSSSMDYPVIISGNARGIVLETTDSSCMFWNLDNINIKFWRHFTIKWTATDIDAKNLSNSLMHQPWNVSINKLLNSALYNPLDLSWLFLTQSVLPNLQKTTFNTISNVTLWTFGSGGLNNNNIIGTTINSNFNRIINSEVVFISGCFNLWYIDKSNITYALNSSFDATKNFAQIISSKISEMTNNQFSDVSFSSSNIWIINNSTISEHAFSYSSIQEISSVNLYSTLWWLSQTSFALVNRMRNVTWGALTINSSNIWLLTSIDLWTSTLSLNNVTIQLMANNNLWSWSFKEIRDSICNNIQWLNFGIWNITMDKVNMNTLASFTVNSNITWLTGNQLSGVVSSEIKNLNVIWQVLDFNPTSNPTLFASNTGKTLQMAEGWGRVVSWMDATTWLNYETN